MDHSSVLGKVCLEKPPFPPAAAVAQGISDRTTHYEADFLLLHLKYHSAEVADAELLRSRYLGFVSIIAAILPHRGRHICISWDTDPMTECPLTVRGILRVLLPRSHPGAPGRRSR